VIQATDLKHLANPLSGAHRREGWARPLRGGPPARPGGDRGEAEVGSLRGRRDLAEDEEPALQPDGATRRPVPPTDPTSALGHPSAFYPSTPSCLTVAVPTPTVAAHLDKGTPGESRGRKATGPRRAPEHRLCQPRDPQCHIEFVNDGLEALARLRSTSSQVSAIGASGGRVIDVEAHLEGRGWITP
jgi:hypothetical protein